MLYSMTAYGTASGNLDGWTWDWELRSVNGRGLDVKMRLPDGASSLEPALRKIVSGKVNRGSLTASLRLARSAAFSDSLDEEVLHRHFERIRTIAAAAGATGTDLAPLTVADALALPGVLVTEVQESARAQELLREAVVDSFAEALQALRDARAQEGAGLEQLLDGLLDELETAFNSAQSLAPERAEHQKRAFQSALDRSLAAAGDLDPDRISQELALIAIKGDVTEELERLRLHLDAARALLAGSGPVGRKLEFLSQEFNREANTLCSKAQYGPLVEIGLDLKATIDQMREQIQNVE